MPPPHPRSHPTGRRSGALSMLVAAALLLTACGDPTSVTVDPLDGEIYLTQALDLLQEHSLHRYEVDWDALRDSALAVAGHPTAPADAYTGIRLALALVGEPHSSFVEPTDSSDQPGNGVRVLEAGGLRRSRPVHLRRGPPVRGPASLPYGLGP